jgi:hypothetical protein
MLHRSTSWSIVATHMLGIRAIREIRGQIRGFEIEKRGG